MGRNSEGRRRGAAHRTPCAHLLVPTIQYSFRLDDPDISASEQPTGRHWIDGRIIYQRTIQTGPLAGGETAPHNIPNIAMVVGIGGISWGPNVAAGVGTTQA